jgi:peptidoglycan biosynthesis protein MviN/MurJ (putative lipid II flippase)
VAGLGAAFSASISSLMAIFISFLVGVYYDGGLLSFAIGILACALASFFICLAAYRSPMEIISYWPSNDSLNN